MRVNYLLKKSAWATCLIVLVLALNSCGSKEDVVYFQNVSQNNNNVSINQYIPKIRPDDMLTITVTALDQDLARPFNLPTVAFNSNGDILGNQRQETYLVDANGNIEFPVLGTLKLGGLNRIQATNMIKGLLKEYLKNPIVNLRTVNFKVTVLGEVRNPGLYTVQNDRITIIEALGLAGDLTIQANRDNLLVIREDNNKKTYHRVSLTNEDIFNSPVYYLAQNDVIYIEPNSSRIKSSTIGPNTNATFNLISTLATVTALIVTITRN